MNTIAARIVIGVTVLSSLAEGPTAW